jgi:hypothetical protein
MSQSTALAAARLLRDALLDHGAAAVSSPWTGRVGGVSIELQEGRGPKPDPWHCRTFVAHLNHHTASATITPDRLTPALWICKNGRTDLQGPLCGGYGGGDFVYRIITMGWANHPGLGGPAEFAGRVVPQDNGRPYLFGTEWDWPGLLSTPWPDAYLEWMARCNAGVLDWLGVPAHGQGEHKDPWAPDRKVDRRLITRAQSIADTRRVWAAPLEDDMTPDECEAAVRRVLGFAAGANLKRPFGQADGNEDFYATLLGNQQGAANVLNAVRGLVSAVRASTDLQGDDEASVLAALSGVELRLAAKVDQTHPQPEPAPGP